MSMVSMLNLSIQKYTVWYEIWNGTSKNVTVNGECMITNCFVEVEELVLADMWFQQDSTNSTRNRWPIWKLVRCIVDYTFDAGQLDT